MTGEDLGGKFMLVFFGYTYCPDVCSTNILIMSAAIQGLGAVEHVQPIFVTIDPERDTPEVMADYVSSFHPGLLGLTGSPEQIARTAKGYRVY